MRMMFGLSAARAGLMASASAATAARQSRVMECSSGELSLAGRGVRLCAYRQEVNRWQIGERALHRCVRAEGDAACAGREFHCAELHERVAVPAAGAGDLATKRRFGAVEGEGVARRVGVAGVIKIDVELG